MNTPCTLRLVDGKKMLVFSLPCINENVVLYTGNPQRSRKTVGPYWKLEIVGISLWWCFGLGLKMTLGHVVTTGMEIVCYLTKSCFPNLIFSSSFSNCVGSCKFYVVLVQNLHVTLESGNISRCCSSKKWFWNFSNEIKKTLVLIWMRQYIIV